MSPFLSAAFSKTLSLGNTALHPLWDSRCPESWLWELAPYPDPSLRNFTKDALFHQGVLEAWQAAHLRKSVTIPEQEGGLQNPGEASL